MSSIIASSSALWMWIIYIYLYLHILYIHLFCEALFDLKRSQTALWMLLTLSFAPRLTFQINPITMNH